MKLKKIGRLQIEPDATSQSLTYWIVRRVIVSVLTIFLIASFLGLTGDGLLAGHEVASADGSLKIKYNYFARREGSQAFEINLKLAQQTSHVKIWFSKQYIDQQYIKQIIPAPIQTETENNIIIFTFAQAGSIARITFMTEPQVIGFVRSSVGMINGSSVMLKQFYYP